ncbi:MAG: SRPBCC domain-containing protein, partial [Actinomycetota bacterium]|nr:SRPBCC domain-containing protein [Actinomycetota bacterium]
MPVTDVTTDPTALTMTLTAELAAPVERVWRAFTDPRQLERFWGPPTYPARFDEFDMRVGGRALYAMEGPTGDNPRGSWEFLSIDEPRGFEVIDSFVDDDGKPLDGFPAMRMSFSFEPHGEGTRLVNTTFF